jgi:hypothetical protein
VGRNLGISLGSLGRNLGISLGSLGRKQRRTEAGDVVTQHTIACCSIQVVDIILVKYQFTNIISLRVVQQKHSGLYSSTEYYKP